MCMNFVLLFPCLFVFSFPEGNAIGNYQENKCRSTEHHQSLQILCGHRCRDRPRNLCRCSDLMGGLRTFANRNPLPINCNARYMIVKPIKIKTLQIRSFFVHRFHYFVSLKDIYGSEFIPDIRLRIIASNINNSVLSIRKKNGVKESPLHIIYIHTIVNRIRKIQILVCRITSCVVACSCSLLIA